MSNRGFFPDHLCETGRQTTLNVLAEEGITAIILTPEETKFGNVESLSDARKCTDLFKAHLDEIDGWMAESNLAASAIQCWTAMQDYHGISPCALMSIMSDNLMPSACETAIAGVVGMYAVSLASQKPSVLIDWISNYGDDLHCQYNACVTPSHHNIGRPVQSRHLKE